MNAEILALLRQILYGRTLPNMPDEAGENVDALAICSDIITLRQIIQNFAKGNFDNDITIRGIIAGQLKTLQANLRHLSWQVQQVAQGDFSQAVDFMGDFSTAFNSMTKQLEHNIGELKREISVREQMEIIIRRNEERWNFAVQCSRDGIWDVNLDTGELWCSDYFYDMFGYNRADFGHDIRWDLLLHPDDKDEAQALYNLMVNKEIKKSLSLECRFRRGNGSYLWVRIRTMAVEGDHGARRVVGVTSDISQQKETEQTLAYRAMHDNLTGLPNRYLLADRMKQQVADAMHRNTSVALFIVDLDNFKGINDTYGHSTGDKLLVEFSKLILQHTREADTVARVGGDEFVLVCPCARGGEVEFINDLAGRMFATLASTKIPLVDEVAINVKMSVGVSFYPEHAADSSELLNHADEALYVVKEQGKNHYEIWTPECTHFATLRKQNGVQVSRI